MPIEVKGCTVLAFLGCQYCGQVNDITHVPATEPAHCGQCNARLIGSRTTNRQVTLALALAALALYVPANLYPILRISQLGMYSENTIFSGVVHLAAGGFWGIAIIVFVASILVPMLKILGLIYLTLPAKETTKPIRRKLAQTLHVIGPWSMLDIFVVAILISLVKLGDLANISTGAGLVAFTGVVVLTTIASNGFDSRHDWLTRGTDD